jgi:transposase-like protein
LTEELDKIVYQDWIEDAMDMREKGLSYRMISERLKEDGYNVSKSVLQRKLS